MCEMFDVSAEPFYVAGAGGRGSLPGTRWVVPAQPRESVDVVVVGAGFAGLYMLHRLRGLGLVTRVIEAGDDVGGTWYWNRYPGARCDVESMEYCYSFDEELQQEWEWTERYPTQPEVLCYIQHVADRFGLRHEITFGRTVTSATWLEDEQRWETVTDDGATYVSRFLIAATGALSVPKDPEIPGLDDFEGRVLRTASWPHEPVDLTGRRVAVIGTGSSGIQVIPEVARQAAEVHVLQRTPNFSVPARNQPLSPEHVADVKNRYDEIRERARNSPGGHALEYGQAPAFSDSPERRRERYEEYWRIGGPGLLLIYSDLRTSEAANAELADFVREKIRETVEDPELARKLSPVDHPIGAKRVCVDTDYYATYNSPRVHLVDVREEPITRFTPRGVATTAREIEADDIVLASGFDALTGALLRMNIVGRDGLSLNEKWAAGPSTYLGVAVHGFPNLFTITGPGSPSVLSNVILSIEQHVDFISGCLEHLSAAGADTVEATEEAETDWQKEVLDAGTRTLFPKARSWYVGANVEGKPQVILPYTGGVGHYRQICADVEADGYRGFAFS